ncbi:hypothetical protein [Streptomyces prunicolor]|uniref:hypothetical protein n=1 Tax=Streptomyces prunicolor TaxID=67348 RepID=UPI00037848FE|nr:hypothetical protein [Streptomyces prunicolor]
MTTVVDQLRKWQAMGGPDLWTQAWDHTVRVVEGPLNGYSIIIDGVIIAEGAAGLAVALYVLAAENGIESTAVTDEQVQALYAGDLKGDERQAQWEERLAALGHDLTDTNDPVVRVWRIVSYNYAQHGDGDDFDFSMTRWGRGYTDGMNRLRSRFGITL